jgi:ATP diphosphatase
VSASSYAAEQALSQLLAIMSRLRDPEQGCAWDLAQDANTLAPYTIEEAYEVVDAIASGDTQAQCEELGDLLLQIVFQAQVASEQGGFSFADVAEAISAKLMRRHPHIFRDGRIDLPRLELSAEQVSRQWDDIKAVEKALKAAQGETPRPAFLDKVGAGHSPLRRAEKLQARAAEVGYDWQDPRLVLAKLREELDEFEQALDQGLGQAALQDELGDIVFCMTNLARQVGVDSEQALLDGMAKFRRRFGYIEHQLQARGKSLHESTREAMEALWHESKGQGL